MLTAGSFLSPRFFAVPPPPLSAGHLTCVGIDLKARADEWLALALPWATFAEQARAGRFRQPLDGVRHLVGRALVRALLARELGAVAVLRDFTLNPYGKPALSGCGIEFNIAHAGDAVWAALSCGAPLGIDVESRAAVGDPLALAESFHPAERAALRALPPDEAQGAFLRCWTRKEAVVKALGEGLSRPLASFCVAVGEAGGDWLAEAPVGATAGWSVADLPAAAGYHASVAAPAPGLEIVCSCG